jgi:hypothetical protein
MDSEIKVTSSRKIYEVLEVMRLKPYLWLTSKSIVSLQNFLNGYMMLGFADYIYHDGEPNFDDFKYWVLNRDERQLGVGNPYSNVLLQECNGDEERAFDKFFECLDEFKKEQLRGK